MSMSVESNDVRAQQEQESEGRAQAQQAPLFDRLVPILFVDDLQAERDFYVNLGFTVTYQGAEFPDFVALGHGSIEFGISRREDFTAELPDRVLTWQFGVTDIEMTKQRLTAGGLAFREEWVAPREDWKYRVLHARTPNGYHLMLEGPGE
jgi:catechol 2,3-dioxygenase-like lactoylglutathione lyase family enzyme